MIAKAAARGAAALLALAAGACILHASGCKNDGTHVYLGQFYLEGRDCLGTPSALDVLEGEASGNCNAICLVQLRAEGGRTVYVSSMCPPLPPAVEFDPSGTDPRCAAALAALARNDTCLSDGGSTAPPPRATAADAATDATDATDAATD